MLDIVKLHSVRIVPHEFPPAVRERACFPTVKLQRLFHSASRSLSISVVSLYCWVVFHWFLFLAIMNNTSVGIQVQVFGFFSPRLSKYTGVQLQRSYVKCMLIFIKTWDFSKVAIPFYVLPAILWEFKFHMVSLMKYLFKFWPDFKLGGLFSYFMSLKLCFGYRSFSDTFWEYFLLVLVFPFYLPNFFFSRTSILNFECS